MTKTCAKDSARFINGKNGYTIGQSHRGSGIRDRAVESAKAGTCGPGGPLQTHQIHQTGDTYHVSRFQNGTYPTPL